MPEQMIKCPNCGTDIKLTEALTETIKSSLRGDVEAEAAKGQAELLKKQKAIDAKEKALSEREHSVNEAVEEKLLAERESLKKEALLKAEKEYGAKAKSLEEELEAKSKKLVDAEKKELNLLKLQRELEEAKQSVDLEVERKITEERKKLQEEASKRAEESQQLKIKEKDDLIENMKKQMADMQRRAELGSQEAQGEALEGQLLITLRATFPFDVFEEIKKGARGADILQTVKNSSGTVCGTILWETKNTKDFQKTWVPKLKKDQQNAGADVAVLMSMVLPKGIQDFAFIEEDDIWLTEYGTAVGLCTALRQGLIKVSRERNVAEHRGTYKDLVYDYVTGQEFAQSVRAVVDAYSQMQQDLDSEKRSMNRIWSKREKQITATLDNVTRMYGELEGLAGANNTLTSIESLMLENIAPEGDGEG